MSKKIIIGGSVLIVIAVCLGAISYSSKIANPFVGLKGLVQISISGEKVEKISDKPLRYISKSSEDFTNHKVILLSNSVEDFNYKKVMKVNY